MSLLGTNKMKKLQEKLDNKKKESANRAASGGGNNDTDFVKFKGSQSINKYKFRIIPWEIKDHEGEGTGSPFVEQYIHTSRDSADKFRKVACPSSHDKSGKSIYDICPICNSGKPYYKPGRIEKDPIANARYSEYKRNFQGFMLVHVVSDPINSDNNGTIKKVFMSGDLRKFLYKEIFGYVPGNFAKKDDAEDAVEEDDDLIGHDGIALEDGFDLIVEVGLKPGGGDKMWNEYSYSFARKSSTIDIDMDELTAAAKELKYQEHYLYSTTEEIEKWHQDIVIPFGEDATTSVPKIEEDTVADLMAGLDDEADEEPEAEAPAPKPAAKAKAKAKTEEKVVEEAVADTDPDSDDFDIDSYLDSM